MESSADKKCNICQKHFPEEILRAHQRLHSEDMFHSCNFCSEVFTTQGLSKHKCKTKKKKYICDISSNLDIHKRVHTGEKPYECDICKKTFSHSNVLSRHKMIHTGKKPYECDICEKTFVQSTTLADHKRIHTTEKPFECDSCQKSYSRRSQLLKHNKTSAHLERKEMLNKDLTSTQINFVECGEYIKFEDIKEEIKEEESVEVPFPIDDNTDIDMNKEIKEEVKESNEGQGVEDSNLDTVHLLIVENMFKYR